MVQPLRSERKGEVVHKSLCLGLVVFPEAGRREEALSRLTKHPSIELGKAQDHRIPAVAQIALGADEALIAELEALPSVIKVAVVYAQAFEEGAHEP